jgi:hypothetical protein
MTEALTVVAWAVSPYQSLPRFQIRLIGMYTSAVLHQFTYSALIQKRATLVSEHGARQPARAANGGKMIA